MKTFFAIAMISLLATAAHARPVLPGSQYHQTTEQNEAQFLMQTECALHPKSCRAEAARQRDQVLIAYFPNRQVFEADREQALHHVVAKPEAAAEYRKALVRLKPLWRKEHIKR